MHQEVAKTGLTHVFVLAMFAFHLTKTKNVRLRMWEVQNLRETGNEHVRQGRVPPVHVCGLATWHGTPSQLWKRASRLLNVGHGKPTDQGLGGTCGAYVVS